MKLKNVTGFNVAILPVGVYIRKMIGYYYWESTIEDVVIGDGSTADRWVTLTTGLAGGNRYLLWQIGFLMGLIIKWLLILMLILLAQ